MLEKVGYFIEEQCKVFVEFELPTFEYIAQMYRFHGSNSRKRTNSKHRRKQSSEPDWASHFSILFGDDVILANVTDTNHIDECNDVIQMTKESQFNILQLDSKYFECIFDWLSLRDLHAIGQSCKQLNKIAGEYFQKNYPAASIRCENDGIYSTSAGQIDGFSSFIEKVSIFGSSTTRLRYISMHCNSIKRLHLDITLTGPKIKSIKHLLAKINVIEIENFEFSDKLFKRFLKQCAHLKCLVVRDIHQKTENNWLHRNYGHLEYFELTPWEIFEINELQSFFIQNENIRCFSTNANCLWINRNAFIGFNVQLNDLAIEIDSTMDIDIGSFCSLLDALYEQQFYKRLHFYVENVDQKTVYQMASLHALEKLYVFNTMPDTDLSCLMNLKELGIHIGASVMDLEMLAKSLINLERVYFYYASSDHMLPFVRHTKHLKCIKVRNLESGSHYDGNILYLSGLSKERAKLYDARKLTIYLEEDVYLNTKWTIDKTNFDLVDIKRGESFVWAHHFRHYLH